MLKKMTTTIFLTICLAGCKPVPKTGIGAERENVYEILIASSVPGNIIVHLNAVEYDKNRVLRQRYSDFYYPGRDILKDGWRNHEHALKGSHSHSILRKDFDRFQFWDYNVDITKGAGAIFSGGYLPREYSWTTDSIPLNELTRRTVVLADPDYEARLDSGVYIPHACRLMTGTNYRGEIFKHVFVYDRDRQMMVAAELRDARTDEIKLRYELIKAIEITRNDFYEFWTEPEECWEDMEIILPDPGAYFDCEPEYIYVLDFSY